MVDFDVLPPQATRPRAGALASLAVHVLVVGPYLLLHDQIVERQTPLEQMVVFLVPPEPDRVGGRPGQGVDWSGVVGSGGAIEQDLPKVDRPEQTLPIGSAGEEVTTIEEKTPGPPEVTETALTEIEVDSVVERDPTSIAPTYPPTLLEKHVEGSTFVHYVVDTTGRVDTTTIQVVRASHPEFAASVRHALAGMKFRPAIQASHRVRQWVQQNFSFRIAQPPPADTT